jgi:hypothetical protein
MANFDDLRSASDLAEQILLEWRRAYDEQRTNTRKRQAGNNGEKIDYDPLANFDLANAKINDPNALEGCVRKVWFQFKNLFRSIHSVVGIFTRQSDDLFTSASRAAVLFAMVFSGTTSSFLMLSKVLLRRIGHECVVSRRWYWSWNAASHDCHRVYLCSCRLDSRCSLRGVDVLHDCSSYLQVLLPRTA